MEKLVIRGNDGQAITTSLKVAEYFGKNHKHVLDAIRDLLDGVGRIFGTPPV